MLCEVSRQVRTAYIRSAIVGCWPTLPSLVLFETSFTGNHVVSGVSTTEYVLSAFLAMNLHVTIQVTRLREAHKTDPTLIRAFAAVRAEMFRQCGAVGEALFTQITQIGSLTRMRSHVSCDGRTLRELSMTYRTKERLFS